MKAANNAPLYAAIYADLAETCRRSGYALAVHGSLARDFDIVAVPWAADPALPARVVESILADFTALRQLGKPSTKEHGRVVYTLMLGTWGESFLDISFMPPVFAKAT